MDIKQLYLVTKKGSGREEHIPIGFFDYESLQREFEIVQSEDTISQVYRWTPCYNVDDYGSIINGVYYVLPVKENRWIPRT